MTRTCEDWFLLVAARGGYSSARAGEQSSDQTAVIRSSSAAASRVPQQAASGGTAAARWLRRSEKPSSSPRSSSHHEPSTASVVDSVQHSAAPPVTICSSRLARLAGEVPRADEWAPRPPKTLLVATARESSHFPAWGRQRSSGMGPPPRQSPAGESGAQLRENGRKCNGEEPCQCSWAVANWPAHKACIQFMRVLLGLQRSRPDSDALGGTHFAG